MASSNPETTRQKAVNSSILGIPGPIRTIFDSFPLKQYPAAKLPPRSLRLEGKVPSLWVHITPEELKKEKHGRTGGYSCSPGCLKWQVYFRFRGIRYRSVRGNEHAASNGGGLPFLIPLSPAPQSIEDGVIDKVITPAVIIPRNKLEQWVREKRSRGKGKYRRQQHQGGEEEEEEQRENYYEEEEVDVVRGDVQAFLELLETKIRDAWLYTIFLIPHNLHNVALPLYASTRSPLIQPFLASDLRTSATNELKRNLLGGVVDPADIYKEADVALEAFSTVLGEDVWFFGGKEPGLFDAAVFGYVHLILELEFEEGIVGLKRGVKRRVNLMQWWKRCVERWERDSGGVA